MFFIRTIRVLIGALTIAAASNLAFADDIRVDPDSPTNGPGDELDWSNAFHKLQDALAFANAGDTIFVAGRITPYYPDKGGGQTNNDPTATFLIDGDALGGSQTLILKGSYRGYNTQSEDPDVQDFVNHPSILSGAIGGTHNCYHVITTTAVGNQTLIEGLIIRDGQGVNILFPQPPLPEDSNRGGGMYNHHGGSPKVVNCIFTNNFAVFGGGMSNYTDGHAIISKCKFIENSAGDTSQDSGASGGAMENREPDPFITSTSTFITNCGFLGNTAYNSAGAVGFQRADGQVMNCLFLGNSVGHLHGASQTPQGSGGGLRIGRMSRVEVVNCTFVANSAYMPGGGAAVSHTNNDGPGCDPSRETYFYNCIFRANTLYNGNDPPLPSQFALGGTYIPEATIAFCNIQGGQAGVHMEDPPEPPGECQGPAILHWLSGNIDADPMFVRNPDLSIGDYGDVRLSTDSPSINRGNCNLVLPDAADLNESNGTQEATPFDLQLFARTVARVDHGAYESAVGVCSGDVTGNRFVDIDDLVQVIVNWGTAGGYSLADIGPSSVGPCGNGTVDIDDLVLVIINWGRDCPAGTFLNIGPVSSVQDCMDLATSDGNTPHSPEWYEFVQKCVDGLCAAQIIICDD